MKGSIVSGFLYSFITKKGKEVLVTDTFAVSRTRARLRLHEHNHKQRLEPVKPYKRYAVKLLVVDEAPVIKEDIEGKFWT
jgi:hypothetical protein